MAEENSVSFKVYLESDFDKSSKQEVRRFGIDRGAVSNFSYLQEKLRSVFPNLRNSGFKVYWRDEDDDDVIISSDEELMIALSSMQTDVYKLFVKLNSSDESNHVRKQTVTTSTSEAKGQSRNTGDVHPNVVCDECDQEVRGFRYKCLQCHDFDLCATCEQKGLHGAHNMLRISTPVCWKPHFGRRLARHLSKANRHQGHPGRGGRCHGGSSEEEKDTSKTEGSPKCGRGKGHGHGHGHGMQAPWYIDMVQQFLGDFAPPAGANSSTDPQKEGADAPAPNMPGNVTHTQLNGEEYLRTVGETVAAFLDPFGINVHVDVEHGGQRTHVSGKEPSKEEKKNDEPKKTESKVDEKQAESKNEKTDKVEPKKVSFSSGVGDGMPTAAATVVDEPKQVEKLADTATKTKTDEQEASGATKTGAESGDGDWMIVTPEPVNASAVEPPKTSDVSEPPQTDSLPEPTVTASQPTVTASQTARPTETPKPAVSPAHTIAQAAAAAAAADRAMRMTQNMGQTPWNMGPHFPGADANSSFRPPPFFQHFGPVGAIPKQPQQQPAQSQSGAFPHGPSNGAPLYPNLMNVQQFPAGGPYQQMPGSYFFPRQPEQQAAREPSHSNPQIADAVDKMMSMGFTNEGGWLAQLLEIKGGDIDKALDVLQPVKKA